MEGSTQWQYPGSCHHTRNYSSLRQKDSAKHSRFIEGIVALKKGGGAGKLREQAALMDSGERFLSARCKRRECGWLAASEAVGRRCQQHSSLQSLLSRRWPGWRAEWLQNCAVGQHGCQLWLRLLFICLNHFLPQEIGRRGQWAGE